jgi:hypothetical protein
MLAPNDGGVDRIVKYLSSMEIGRLKAERLHEQLVSLIGETRTRLEIFDIAGGEEVEAKRKRAEWLVSNIADNEPPRFAELLDALTLEAEQMRSCYLSIDARGAQKTSSAAGSGSFRSLLKKGGHAQNGEQAPTLSDRASRFADVVISAWINQLRELPLDEKVLRHVKVQSETARVIVDEVVAGALRTKLIEKIAQACSETEMAAGRRRSVAAEEQVLIARQELTAFLSYFGSLGQARSTNILVSGRQIFPTVAQPTEIVDLVNVDHGEHVLLTMSDWLTALHDMVISNAGFQEGSELSPAQARALSAIIGELDGQAKSLAA